METPSTVGIAPDDRIRMYERTIQMLSQDLQECRKKLGQPMGMGLFGQGGKRHSRKHSKMAKKSRKMKHRRKSHKKSMRK